MNNKVISKKLIERTLSEEFDEAEVFTAETEHQLNEVEQYFARDLKTKGMDVRFNKLHILVRGESNTVFSYLRDNLPMDD